MFGLIFSKFCLNPCLFFLTVGLVPLLFPMYRNAALESLTIVVISVLNSANKSRTSESALPLDNFKQLAPKWNPESEMLTYVGVKCSDCFASFLARILMICQMVSVSNVQYYL